VPPRSTLHRLRVRQPKLKALKGWVLGKTLADRAPNGLWPSDHPGVAIKLKMK
jgi:hypothetical protein